MPTGVVRGGVGGGGAVESHVVPSENTCVAKAEAIATPEAGAGGGAGVEAPWDASALVAGARVMATWSSEHGQCEGDDDAYLGTLREVVGQRCEVWFDDEILQVIFL